MKTKTGLKILGYAESWSYDPYRALVAAILMRGLADYYQSSSQDKRIRMAELWVWSSDKDYPFSFLNICDVLDLDPQMIRSSLDDPEVEKAITLELAKGQQTKKGETYDGKKHIRELKKTLLRGQD